MAIINCPECDDCVSDNAEKCPHCGYGIKLHYEKIRERELEQEKLQNRLDNIPRPNKPKFFNESGQLAIFFVVCLGIGLLSQNILLIYGGGICTIILIILDVAIYVKQTDDYELSLSDFDEYKRKIIAREDEWAEYENSKIRCPICNSSNVDKIDVVERAVSVSVVGLASGKIGKQYKCKKCKHLW